MSAPESVLSDAERDAIRRAAEASQRLGKLADETQRAAADRRAAIVELWEGGWSYAKLAAVFDVSRSAIQNVVQG